MNGEDLQQEEAKRRRLAAELRVAAAAHDAAGTFDEDTDMGDDGENDGAAVMLPMTYEQLTEVKFKETCFACKYINAGSMRENPEFVTLMKLYTENAEAVSQPALFRLVKAHFDRHCRPIVREEWTLPCIEEHFTVHTNYPTDEILKQLKVLTSIRNNMISTALLRNVRNNAVEPLNNNIKNLVIIQKEIRELMLAKKKISTMLGYSEILDY